MNRKKMITSISVFGGMLILILDSRCTLESCREAMKLCTETVIPSLFPFLFLSGLISNVLWGDSGQIIRFIGWILNIPSGAESIMISGFLGGYPAGAQAIGDAYHDGRLQNQDARHLLRYCSNAGPAFLFGMIGPLFPDKRMIWYLWMIHILSAAITGMRYGYSGPVSRPSKENRVSVSQHMLHSLKATAVICGWIILFRIIIGYLDRWFLWFVPEYVRVLLCGFLELSNGCFVLAQIESVSVRFILCSVILSFGGVCVLMQTISVTDGLPAADYVCGKLIQTIISFVLSLCTVCGYEKTVLAATFLLLIFPKIRKINVAFRGFPMYNKQKQSGGYGYALSKKN